MVPLAEPWVETNDKLDARSDLELIAAINGGDPVAFEVLYFRYRDWVVGLAYRFTADDDAALEDVLRAALSDVKRLRKMGEESYRIVCEEINIEKMVDVFVEAVTGK